MSDFEKFQLFVEAMGFMGALSLVIGGICIGIYSALPKNWKAWAILLWFLYLGEFLDIADCVSQLFLRGIS